MSYKIDYSIHEHAAENKRFFSRAIWTASFFLIFIFMVTLCWPEGREVLRLMLFPDGQFDAIEVLACELESGSELKAAVSDYIHAIVKNESIR